MTKSLAVALDIAPLLGTRTGVGNVTYELVKHLAARDDITVSGFLVSFRGRLHLDSLTMENVTPLPLPVPAALAHRLWQKVDWPTLRSHDIVHGTNYVVPPAPRSTEVVTIHDLTAWRFPELLTTHTQRFPALVSRALKRGAHIHVVSDFVANEVVDYLEVEQDRVHVIHNGYSPQQQQQNEPISTTYGRYILALGTIEPRKDYPTLIAAMHEVWQEHSDVKLVVAGAKGWGHEAFEQALDLYNARDKVICLGYVDDAKRTSLLRNAEMLVYPSLYEGFGLPLLEAMGVETPVVSTAVGAIPEVVDTAASLVPPKAPEALAGAILDVLENDEIRKYLVEAGKKRTALYSWEKSADALVSMYRKIRLCDS